MGGTKLIAVMVWMQGTLIQIINIKTLLRGPVETAGMPLISYEALEYLWLPTI